MTKRFLRLGCGLRHLGFGSCQGQHAFILFQMLIRAQRSIQRPIQWVQVAMSPGIKRSGREADHSLPSIVEVKNERSYTATPSVCLHGMEKESYFI
jgi:hypothetical protein